MSNDSLTGWMVGYIRGIKSGMRPADALAAVGIGLEEFSRARMENAAFASAVTLTESGVGATEITAVELLRLREAQTTEARCAAWFGMRVEDFRAALEKNEALKNAYDMGPGRGQANVQVAQYDRAVCGDPTMLKHYGEHYLDQKPKATVELNVGALDEMIKKLESQLMQRGVAIAISGPDVIEGEWTEGETDPSGGE